MTVFDEFWKASVTAAQAPDMVGPYLWPVRLAWAATRALHVDGVGLSMSANPSFRMPLGASDDAASAAERLQFTAGEGPCLDAHARGETITASEAVLTRTWPVFAQELLARTPFRSIFAAPLHGVGAVDIYFTDPLGATTVAVGDVEVVVEQIQATVMNEDLFSGDPQEQLWVTPAVRARGQVSVAIGMLTVSLRLGHRDGLSVLRAYAFRTGRQLEDVAADMIDGTLTAEQLQS